MGNSIDFPGDYRIEVSGWGLGNNFFVEKADLLWTPGGEKKVQLHRALPEGTIVFVRLMASEASNGSVPVAYQVAGVEPMDCNGRCQMKLTQLHVRSKESPAGKYASNELEDSPRVCDQKEGAEELQQEEILQ